MRKYRPKIVAYSLRELAMLYKISKKTMRKRLKTLGLWEYGKRLYFPNEVRKIFNVYGVPELSEDDYIYFSPHKMTEITK